METVSATDIGEGFGMPSTESPEKILEVAIGRLFRDSPEIRLRSLARQPGCELDVTQMWALLQIYRQNQVFGSATLTDIAERLQGAARGHRAHLRRSGRQRSAHCGPAGGCGSPRPGVKEVDAISALIVGRIVDKLATSSSFEGRPDRGEVEAALERIAHRMLVQRDWTDDRSELTAAR